MSDQIKMESENKFLTNILILSLGGIGMFFLCYYLTSASLKGPYPQISGIILGGFFGFIGCLSLVSIYSLDKIFVYEDRVIFKSIFGNIKKIIYLQDIVSWTEIVKKSKYNEWKDLTIYTENTKYKFSSSFYYNYRELRNALVKGKSRDLQRQSNWLVRNNLYFGIGFVIMGGLFSFAAYHFYSIKDHEIQPSELQTIHDVIINKAEIEKGSKGSSSISINLKSYPAFYFKIAGNGYSETFASDYVANVEIGDTLSLEVLKDEYQMKLTKEKPLGFWDKTVNYSFISVYSLRDKKNVYLNLSDYNRARKIDAPIGILLFGFVGLLVLGYGIYLLIKNI